MTDTDAPPPAPPLTMPAIDWAHLVDVCEQRGIPVARADPNGLLRVLRTAADLAAWPANPTTTTTTTEESAA